MLYNDYDKWQYYSSRDIREQSSDKDNGFFHRQPHVRLLQRGYDKGFGNEQDNVL